MSAGQAGPVPAGCVRAGGRDSGERALGRAAVLGSGVPGTGASRRGWRRPRSAGTAPGAVRALPGLGGDRRERLLRAPSGSEWDKSRAVRSQLALPPVRREAEKKTRSPFLAHSGVSFEKMRARLGSLNRPYP